MNYKITHVPAVKQLKGNEMEIVYLIGSAILLAQKQQRDTLVYLLEMALEEASQSTEDSEDNKTTEK